MGQLFFIIASTPWAEPMQLIPQVFNVFAIDTLAAFLFTAVTSSIITSMLQVKILSKVLYSVNQASSSTNCNQKQANDNRTHTSSVHKYNDIDIDTTQGTNQQAI
jgi:hypothetical protein